MADGAGGELWLLIRAHYAVTAALHLQEDAFVRDVSAYPTSTTSMPFLDRPMFCFVYDLEEYEEKRGLYLPLAKHCPVP